MGILGRLFDPRGVAGPLLDREDRRARDVNQGNRRAVRRAERKDEQKYKDYMRKIENPYGLNKKELGQFKQAQYKGVREAMKPHTVKLENLSPEQKKAHQLLGGKVKSDIEQLRPLAGIQKPSETEEFRAGKRSLLDILSGSPQAMEKYQSPLIRQYKEQLIPEITQRFSGQFGPQRGSGFRNALTEAASQLSQRLGEQKNQLQEGARHQALSYAQMPMQEQQNIRGMALNENQQLMNANPYQQAYYPPQIPGAPAVAPFRAAPPPQLQQAQPGFLHNLIGQFAGPAMGAAGMAMGGPIGGAIGGQIGNMIGQGMQPQQAPQQQFMR